MAVAKTCDAEWRRRSMSVICARCSRVLRSSFIKAGEINHEAGEGHQEFVEAKKHVSCVICLVMRRISEVLIVAVLVAVCGCQKSSTSSSEFAAQRQKMVEE